MPHSPSAQRNRQPIYAVLEPLMLPGCRVLELGSGTGEHAHFFCTNRPDIHWQPSEHPAMLARLCEGLSERRAESAGLDTATAPEGRHTLGQLAEPVAIDMHETPWQLEGSHDVIYSCNTLHMVPWSTVLNLISESARLLRTQAAAPALLCLYAPMSIAGQHTSEGNLQFDRQLRESNDLLGIRDLNELDAVARSQGLVQQAVHSMPANNRLAIWSVADAD